LFSILWELKWVGWTGDGLLLFNILLKTFKQFAYKLLKLNEGSYNSKINDAEPTFIYKITTEIIF